MYNRKILNSECPLDDNIIEKILTANPTMLIHHQQILLRLGIIPENMIDKVFEAIPDLTEIQKEWLKSTSLREAILDERGKYSKIKHI